MVEFSLLLVQRFLIAQEEISQRNCLDLDVGHGCGFLVHLTHHVVADHLDAICATNVRGLHRDVLHYNSVEIVIEVVCDQVTIFVIALEPYLQEIGAAHVIGNQTFLSCCVDLVHEA